MKLEIEKVREIGGLDFLAKQLVEGFVTGLHKSPYHGFSVEFSEHQLYNTGQSTKNIDWKVFAKTDRLYTKRYEEETNLRCQIIIDNSSSMHYPEKTLGKITFSIVAAAALSYLLQKQRDAVGICSFSDTIEWMTPIKSTSNHLNKLLSQLEFLLKSENKNRSTNTGQILHEIANKTPRRSLIVLFSDMLNNENDLESIFTGLQHLKHKKHEVLLFHVTDKATELNFEFEDRPHEFVDLESGESLKLQTSDIKSHYQEQASSFFKEVKMRCAKLKIDLIEADINQDYNEILKLYLVKRARLK